MSGTDEHMEMLRNIQQLVDEFEYYNGRDEDSTSARKQVEAALATAGSDWEQQSANDQGGEIYSEDDPSASERAAVSTVQRVEQQLEKVESMVQQSDANTLAFVKQSLSQFVAPRTTNDATESNCNGSDTA